jgi:oxygen-independent coproporphyrinogen-3 oxidase
VDALGKELTLRKVALDNEKINTIYFGGGTPSLLSSASLQQILDTIRENYATSTDVEITLEANPDDLNSAKLQEFKTLGINRLSIGIQSFSNEVLQWMNRAHTGIEAINSVKQAKAAGFENITIDLIYGVPGLSLEDWKSTLKQAIDLGVDHISSYCLTVESDTALGHRVAKGIEKPMEEALAAEHFLAMVAILEEAGYEQYEISNFARKKRYSRHNTAYWTGAKYIGIGPSAHSFDGLQRSWNVSSNPRYIKSIGEGQLPSESELLTPIDGYNEWVMTGLRTQWGIAPGDAQERYGVDMVTQFGARLTELIERDLAEMHDDRFVLTRNGRLLADGIASELFVVK